MLLMYEEGFRWWHMGLRRGDRLRAVRDHARSARCSSCACSGRRAMKRGACAIARRCTRCWSSGALRDARAAAVDGLGLVHAAGRGEHASRRRCCRGRATLAALRGPVHAARTWRGTSSTARSSRSRATLLSLLVNSMAGYAFAKLRFRGPRAGLPGAARRRW